MHAAAKQSHVDRLMVTIIQMTEINKILGYQIKNISETNAILDRQDQEEKKQQTKMRVTLENWIQPDILGLVGVGSPRGTPEDPEKLRRMYIRMEPQYQKLWGGSYNNKEWRPV